MSEWIIVAVIGVILLFSAKKLPDMARGLGQSMRIFKAETRGMREDDQRGATSTGQPAVEATGSTTAAAPGRVAEDPAPSTPATPAAPSAASPESRPGGSPTA